MSAVDLAELVAAPPGHEWHEVGLRDDEYIAAPTTHRRFVNDGSWSRGRRFVARPVVPWPTTPGEYRMRRADGVVVTALLDGLTIWHWLHAPDAVATAADHIVQSRSLLTPVGDAS